MKLDTEFRKLPLSFDAERLAIEVAQFTESDWRAHPQGHKGNTAIPFIAVNGDPTNDGVKGPMQPTPLLARCPYIRQVLASFGSVLGRTRLMRIAGQGEATAHVDTNYYWMQRVRVHVPVVTFPEVEFVCGGKVLHMAPGECWIFDTWRLHNVLNPNSRDRIHLVADTVGSAAFWDLAAQAERPFAEDATPRKDAPAARRVPYQPGTEPELETENQNFPVVMTPWEQECLIVRILEDMNQCAENSPELAAKLEVSLERFYRQWRALWARHGDTAAGWPAFKQLLAQFDAYLGTMEKRLSLVNDVDATEALRQAIVRSALNPDLAAAEQGSRQGDGPPLRHGDKETGGQGDARPATPSPIFAVPADASLPASLPPVLGASRSPASVPSRFERPIIIVAAPRSGSTFLFETLSRSPSVYTVGGESHAVFEGIAKLDPMRRGFDSNRLTAADWDSDTAATLKSRFQEQLRDRENRRPAAGASVRLLEKTPKNALRVPFLDTIFPDALFIFLYREPNENLSSILEAWKSGKFVTYPRLPDWVGPSWSLLLVPEWRQLIGKSLPQIAATQWASANKTILDDLAPLPADRWCTVAYDELVANPQAEAQRLCRFAGIAWDQQLQGAQPLSRHTLTPPDPNKWRKNAAALEPVLPRIEPVAARVRQLLGRAPLLRPSKPERKGKKSLSGAAGGKR